MEHQITIYTLPSCAFCKEVKKFFKSKKILFKEVDVNTDPEAQAEMISKSGQFSVPVIDFNGQVVVGFQKNILEMLLQTHKK